MKEKVNLWIYPFVIVGVLLILTSGCKKKDDTNNSTPTPQVPTLTTVTVSSIAQTTAISGGNVTSEGSSVITNRGVCWNTSQSPTISDDHTTDGSGTGSFTSNLTTLTMNTLYYVRAYATNSAGTGYGNEVSFTTKWPPTVITTDISKITIDSAFGGGNVTDQGGSPVTSRGICWSTAQNPTTSDPHTSDGSGTGSFTSQLTGLSLNTHYFVRAYAINNDGTVYGNEVSFTTLSSPYTIGQHYGGGMIISIDGTGLHGLIVALSDQSGGTDWTTANQLCTNYNGGGHNDWRLPYRFPNELGLFYDQKFIIPGFTNAGYWGELYYTGTSAWTISIMNGGLYAYSLGSSYGARAVRAF